MIERVPRAREIKEQLTKAIEQVGDTANDAKATADTAAESVNEYMDALLGLNTTGANDAE